MVFFILVVVVLSIRDIVYMKSKGTRKDIYVYLVIILLFSAFGIYYLLNPDCRSFAKIMLSLAGKDG